jgi:hypothetical protein
MGDCGAWMIWVGEVMRGGGCMGKVVSGPNKGL